MNSNLYHTYLMLITTTISTAIFIAKKINIFDDFNAFEVSVYETIIRAILLLIYYFFSNFKFSFNKPVTDYLIISGSTIYYFALKFLFFNIYKNTENIAVTSTIRSILGIVLTFVFQYLFLNKQITFYNMIAIIWISIGLIFLI